MNQQTIVARKMELEKIRADYTRELLDMDPGSTRGKFLYRELGTIQKDLLDLLAEAIKTDDRLQSAGMHPLGRLTCWSCKTWGDQEHYQTGLAHRDGIVVFGAL